MTLLLITEFSSIQANKFCLYQVYVDIVQVLNEGGQLVLLNFPSLIMTL